MKQRGTRKNCFRYLKLMSPLNAAICTTISYTLWVEWYYLKNNYLTLRSKVKVPQRSLRYMTHHRMVTHPHTNYHWPILKDKNVMARIRKYYSKNNYLTLRSKVKVQRGHYGTRHTALWSCTHTYQISLTYLERQNSYGPDKLRWEEAEEEEEVEEKIRLKQYVSLRSKGRHNYSQNISHDYVGTNFDFNSLWCYIRIWKELQSNLY